MAKRIILIIVFIILAVFQESVLFKQQNIQAETVIRQQTIQNNTTWLKAESPYFIEGDIIVDNDVTLHIEPGVELRFNGFYGIIIKGKIISKGTQNDVITITSNLTNPFFESWKGIKMESEEQSIIEYCTINYGEYGVYTEGSSNVTFKSNSISHCSVGIFIYQSSHMNIIDNNIFGNSHEGVLIGHSSFNTFTNNNLYVNGNGISIYHTSNNQITNNTIISNSDGIFISDRTNNVTIEGNIVNNNNRGIYLRHSYDNIIIHNNFMNNSNQAYYQPSYDIGNDFNNNHWHDYIGNDTNHDGFWDEPYLIEINSQDVYPSVEPHLDIGSTLPINNTFMSFTISVDKDEIISSDVVNITISITEGLSPALNVDIDLSSNIGGSFSDIVSDPEGNYYVTYFPIEVENETMVIITTSLFKRGFDYGTGNINLVVSPEPVDSQDGDDLQYRNLIIGAVIINIIVILLLIYLFKRKNKK